MTKAAIRQPLFFCKYRVTNYLLLVDVYSVKFEVDSFICF
jgi:hypothetical protein